jgi:endonuclease YncB( thermonuclease family)
MLMLAALAVLLGIPLLDKAVESAWNSAPTRWPDGRIEIKTEFGRCHEGGGKNCVVDGDTVWIGGEKVRIQGIDAPETHEPKCDAEERLGTRSADRLQALLSSGTVVATRGERDRDPNGRLLRNLAVDGRDVGQTLIEEGLARAYGGSKKGWCG